MPNDQQGALLAHISDTVTQIREEQGAVVAILSRLVETAQAHTEMLSEIMAAARQDAGPSETVQLLAELTAAVRDNTQAINTMAEQIAALPEEIGAEVAEALGEDAEGEEA